MKKESPEYVRMSLAAAMTLDYRGGLFYRNARSPCINLLLTYESGCAGNCAYCGLSMKRPGHYGEKSFIRVRWDAYELGDVMDRIGQRPGRVKRICLSMVTNSRAPGDSLSITGQLTGNLPVPVSVLISPTITTRDLLVQLKKNGVQMIGLALDGATEEIFDRYRGRGVKGPHSWARYWTCFQEALEIFGAGNVGVHLIVGLGETEQMMLSTIQKIHDMGGGTHLFSFFPEHDSALSRHPQPPIRQYRAVQTGRYIIAGDTGRFENMAFDDAGRVCDFNVDAAVLEEIVASGLPYVTTGCPNTQAMAECNRPYSDSLPGPEIRNFPFMPESDDIEQIERELAL